MDVDSLENFITTLLLTCRLDCRQLMYALFHVSNVPYADQRINLIVTVLLTASPTSPVLAVRPVLAADVARRRDSLMRVAHAKTSQLVAVSKLLQPQRVQQHHRVVCRLQSVSQQLTGPHLSKIP